VADINNVVLTGRLTRDAELKYTANGQAVCKFSLAVNRRRKNGDKWEEEANFFDVVLWGRQGETLNQYLVKGKAVGIYGELRQDRWQQDGQNRSKIEVVASNVQLMGGGGSGSGAQSSGGNEGAASQSSWQNNQGGGDAPPPPSDGNFTDDIPF
jgi:single-strand DNA-binding protein